MTTNSTITPELLDRLLGSNYEKLEELTGEDGLKKALIERAPGVVGIDHHLLSLARIGPHKQHPAVAELNAGHLHDHRHAVQQDNFVAPVELVGFSKLSGT